jgi:hypothetical protein
MAHAKQVPRLWVAAIDLQRLLELTMKRMNPISLVPLSVTYLALPEQAFSLEDLSVTLHAFNALK